MLLSFVSPGSQIYWSTETNHATDKGIQSWEIMLRFHAVAKYYFVGSVHL